jgi:hypothetical protein
VASSKGTDLTGDPTGLTGHAKKVGRVKSVTPDIKVMGKKPSFAELLQKYQKIAKQKQSNRLGDESWKLEFFITESKEASTIIILVFIVYSINACAMEWLFRYKQLQFVILV